jgi:hypothetical protein
MRSSAGAGPRSAAHAALQLQALDGFAAMLSQLEWNGKVREAEASQQRAQAAGVREAYPELPDGSKLVHGSTAWYGIEPWYNATFCDDWLGAAVPSAGSEEI